MSPSPDLWLPGAARGVLVAGAQTYPDVTSFEKARGKVCLKIAGKMGTTLHGFVATDTIKHPALLPKAYHNFTCGEGWEGPGSVTAERLETPAEAG